MTDDLLVELLELVEYDDALLESFLDRITIQDHGLQVTLIINDLDPQTPKKSRLFWTVVFKQPTFHEVTSVRVSNCCLTYQMCMDMIRVLRSLSNQLTAVDFPNLTIVGGFTKFPDLLIHHLYDECPHLQSCTIPLYPEPFVVHTINGILAHMDRKDIHVHFTTHGVDVGKKRVNTSVYSLPPFRGDPESIQYFPYALTISANVSNLEEVLALVPKSVRDGKISREVMQQMKRQRAAGYRVVLNGKQLFPVVAGDLPPLQNNQPATCRVASSTGANSGFESG